MKVVSSEEGFREHCPCADEIFSYVSQLPELNGVQTAFGKAIIRPEHTTALFICLDYQDDPIELWISATSDAMGGWELQHTPFPIS